MLDQTEDYYWTSLFTDWVGPLLNGVSTSEHEGSIFSWIVCYILRRDTGRVSHRCVSSCESLSWSLMRIFYHIEHIRRVFLLCALACASLVWRYQGISYHSHQKCTRTTYLHGQYCVSLKMPDRKKSYRNFPRDIWIFLVKHWRPYHLFRVYQQPQALSFWWVTELHR